jgi:hypothetical protein
MNSLLVWFEAEAFSIKSVLLEMVQLLAPAIKGDVPVVPA